ncbi:hypothetical protein DLJ96_06040 [Actinotalea fermentans ATCC 43279 = JCM 9966 = DSM 3133]|nr:hypothetical protein DLJ96_06040 [Actinotalea fermentans ATCC 43279 = JCM 9966 = DSM 3133]
MSDGAWGLALVRLAIAVVVLVAAWVVWDRALAKALVAPHGGASAGKSKGLGWFDRFPATPVGAVAARCLTYWFRDPRYSGSIAVVPLLPVLLWFVGSSMGIDGGDGFKELMLVLGPVTAFTFGFAISADVAYDHTAFWTQVSSGVSGFADRAGRVLAAAVIGVPVVLVFAVASVAFTGRWDLLVATIGLSLGVLGAGLGVSSVVSARLLYPVPKPGDSPFKSPQGAAMATLVAQMITMLVLTALCLPAAGLALTNVLTGAAVWGWLTLVVGVGLGVVFLVVGMRWGGRLVDQRGPELLQQVMSYK